jgi:hypothetical protein
LEARGPTPECRRTSVRTRDRGRSAAVQPVSRASADRSRVFTPFHSAPSERERAWPREP